MSSSSSSSTAVVGITPTTTSAKENTTTNSKKKKASDNSNVNQKLLTEFQSLIAYACYDSPSIAGRGESLTESMIEKLMSKLCFGSGYEVQENEDQDDDEIICYLDQFISGLNKFEGLYTNTVDTGPNGDVLLTIPPSLHRQGSITLYVGHGSIERKRLSRKTVTSDHPITGRTLLRLAKEVLANCKKMMALVKSPSSPYKDGNFPSGTNWDDYAKWCLDSMYRQDVEDKQGTTKLPTSTNVDDAGPLVPSVPAPQAQVEVEEQQHDTTSGRVLKFPSGYFFKGFLAWCLWGHIPIVENGSTTMRSFLFTDGKASTSFGRRKGSKKRPPAAVSVKDNNNQHRSNKRQHSSVATSKTNENGGDSEYDNEYDNEYEMLMSTTTSITGTTQQAELPVTRGMLSATIAIMKHESVEKELQKTSHLEVRIIRDKIAAVNRKYDHVSKRYYGLNMRQGHQLDSPFLLEMEREMNAYHKEIGNLELELEQLQRLEVTRRGKSIALLRQSMLVADEDDKNKAEARSSFAVVDTTTNNTLPTSGVTPHLTSTSPLSTGSTDEQETDFVTPMPATTTATVNHSDGTRKKSTVCIECSIMPSTHQCRRCKQYVCATCCSSKRSLEMIWWCGTCFEQESLTTQNFIRAGNYNSDSSTSSDD
jgi:hypothetical protein